MHRPNSDLIRLISEGDVTHKFLYRSEIMKGKLLADNIKYMLKNWIEWDKKSLIYFFINVPALVLQPIIISFIPKAMIDCIQNGVTIERLIIVVALLSALVTITTWLAPFMNELLYGSGRIIRMRYAVMAFRKNLNTDYINIESLKGREKNKRAADFYYYYNSAPQMFISICSQICVSVIGLAASLALISRINIWMILLICFTCVGEFFIAKYLNNIDKNSKDKTSSVVVKFNYYYELSKDNSAAKDISIYGFGDHFLMMIAKLLHEVEKILYRYMNISMKVNGVRALLNLLRELVAYAYLVYLVMNEGMSVSDFIFCFGIITGFSNWMLSLVSCYSQLERCCRDCAEFRSFLDENTAEKSDENGFCADTIESIEFRDVFFRYPEAETDTIKGMSFKVGKGENIAIVGENGAGKTTAVKLLCGLYDVTKGDVLINGKSSREIPKSDYFDLFSPVFQDYTFLPMTVAENVCACSEYDKERLYEAFEKAGRAEKINSLAEKENTLMVRDIYKDAVDFSGGEKQKLLLAKAIYKDAKILILDEPTAALDPIAENELYLKYNELTKDKISFFISHRLSSTRFCDRIMFISDGKIAEYGTHEELMELKGAYFRMYQMQSYYYKEAGGEQCE